MKVLLPHRFKRTGAIVAPFGFILWLLMQYGVVNKVLGYMLGEPKGPSIVSAFHAVNVIVAITGFLSFLAGMYFVSFSKEKIEDEMINKLRLDSFQFAAFVQLVFIIAGFLGMIIFGSPAESWLMLFFIATLFLFWLTYIAKFNFAIKMLAGNEK